jgi:hypothetical protein
MQERQGPVEALLRGRRARCLEVNGPELAGRVLVVLRRDASPQQHDDDNQRHPPDTGPSPAG